MPCAARFVFPKRRTHFRRHGLKAKITKTMLLISIYYISVIDCQASHPFMEKKGRGIKHLTCTSLHMKAGNYVLSFMQSPPLPGPRVAGLFQV